MALCSAIAIATINKLHAVPQKLSLARVIIADTKRHSTDTQVNFGKQTLLVHLHSEELRQLAAHNPRPTTTHLWSPKLDLEY